MADETNTEIEPTGLIAEAIEEGRFISSKRNPQPVAVPRRSAEEEAAFRAQPEARHAGVELHVHVERLVEVKGARRRRESDEV